MPQTVFKNPQRAARRASLRRAVFLAILLALLNTSAMAQDKRDGNYWRTIGETEKLDILLGIFDGMSLMENIISIVLKQDYTICTDVIESIMRQTSHFLDDLTTEQIAGRLDKFFQEPQNRNIPIYWGVWVVARESKGDKNVARFVKELRKSYK